MLCRFAVPHSHANGLRIESCGRGWCPDLTVGFCVGKFVSKQLNFSRCPTFLKQSAISLSMTVKWATLLWIYHSRVVLSIFGFGSEKLNYELGRRAGASPTPARGIFWDKYEFGKVQARVAGWYIFGTWDPCSKKLNCTWFHSSWSKVTEAQGI